MLQANSTSVYNNGSLYYSNSSALFFSPNTTVSALNSTHNVSTASVTDLVQNYLVFDNGTTESLVSAGYNKFIDYLADVGRSFVRRFSAPQECSFSSSVLPFCEWLGEERHKVLLKKARIPFLELEDEIGSIHPEDHPEVKELDQVFDQYCCDKVVQYAPYPH